MNPFQAFRSYSAVRRELPLDRILARRDQVLQRLLQSYQALIEEESKQLVWVVEQGRPVARLHHRRRGPPRRRFHGRRSGRHVPGTGHK